MKLKLKGLSILVIIVAMCALVASASAPPTPFMIYGYVSYENGGACNNPTVNINNTNTGNNWSTEIKTNASSNYYQLMLANGTDVNASEILRFNVTSPNGNQSNITEHTVTQENITDGGLFNFNITLEAPPEVVINEIMYNPDSVQGVDKWMEWVELYNNGTSEVNISGWRLGDLDGYNHTFLVGTSISANGYIIIANNKTHFLSYYHYVNESHVLNWNGSAIGNGWLKNTSSDGVILWDDTNVEIDNVTYIGSWSGDGYTLEINASGGWQESNSYSGTPLDTNSVVDLEPVILDYEPHNTNPTNNSGGIMTFRVKANQNVNVTWYINESLVYTNISVDADTWANYTNESAKAGYWNVSAIITNANGTDMQTWWWTVEKTVGTTFTVTLPTGYEYAIFKPANSTATNESPGGQNWSTAFYNVTNTGNVNLSVRMQLDATVSNILLKADIDNTPDGAKEVNTTLVTIFSPLEQWDSVEIWIWSDFSHAIEQQTNKTLSINVTQA